MRCVVCTMATVKIVADAVASRHPIKAGVIIVLTVDTQRVLQ